MLSVLEGSARQRRKNATNIVTFPLYPLAYPIRNPCSWNEIIRKDCAFVSHAGSNNTSSERARMSIFLLNFRAPFRV